jgi:hypothetical protein
MLFSESEASLVALLPIKPFSARQASRVWKKTEADTRSILDRLSSRGILIDSEQPDGSTLYSLPPPMAGFFEFSLMRVRDDVDQKVLSELFYQYLNVEEAFIRDLFVRGETQIGRVFVHEPSPGRPWGIVVRVSHNRRVRSASRRWTGRLSFAALVRPRLTSGSLVRLQRVNACTPQRNSSYPAFGEEAMYVLQEPPFLACSAVHDSYVVVVAADIL